MDFGTYATGWRIEGDLLSQVAVSTGFTVYAWKVKIWGKVSCFSIVLSIAIVVMCVSDIVIVRRLSPRTVLST